MRNDNASTANTARNWDARRFGCKVSERRIAGTHANRDLGRRARLLRTEEVGVRDGGAEFSFAAMPWRDRLNSVGWRCAVLHRSEDANYAGREARRGRCRPA